jgi:hypothetical protein
MLSAPYCCLILTEFGFISTDFDKKSPMSNFTKIRRMGADLIMQTHGRTDGRTDMKKLTGAFRAYANAPKKHSRIRNMFIIVIQQA